MAPLKPISYTEARSKLLSAGFREVGQVGSHVKFAREVEGGLRTVIVPRHREIAVGTLRSILRQAALTTDEWGDL